MKENPIYALMDIKKEGSMVRMFEEEGVEGLRALCLFDIQHNYLYAGGEGRTVTHQDYAAWRSGVDHNGSGDKVWQYIYMYFHTISFFRFFIYFTLYFVCFVKFYHPFAVNFENLLLHVCIDEYFTRAPQSICLSS